MPSRAAAHVLMIEPVALPFNPETEASNPFQRRARAGDETRLRDLAIEQHRRFRAALVTEGVCVTVVRSRHDTPDAPFCNNWFSTHRRPTGPSLVLYPMLAPSRRQERRRDLVDRLRATYPTVIDLSPHELAGAYLEGTGSLCLDDDSRLAFVSLSPRSDATLAADWADQFGYRLVTFTARDAEGIPFYHTNVMMFIGHGAAVVCLAAIDAPTERVALERALIDSGNEVIPITREQALRFCGNGLALVNDCGDPVFALSTAAHEAFTPEQRRALERRGRIVHADLSSFEQLGGGSARCLLGELM